MNSAFINITDASGARRVPLTGRLTMGRHSTNDVCLADVQASRFHCAIVKKEDGYVLTDLQSSNGTLLNGKRVQSAQLADGDVVTIGATKILFRDPARPRSAKTNPTKPAEQKLEFLADDDVLDEL